MSQDAPTSTSPTLEPRQFKRLLQRAVIPPTLLLIAFAGVLAWQVSNLLVAYRSKDQSDHIISLSRDLSSQLLEMEGGLRGYVISSDASLLDTYERSLKSMDGTAQQLVSAVKDSPDQSARASQLAPLLAQWRRHAESLRRQVANHQSVDPHSITAEGERIMDNLQIALQGIVSAEISVRDARMLAIRRAAMGTLWIGGGVAVILGLVLASIARRQLLAVASSYEDALTISFLQADEIERRENLLSLIADTIPAIITYLDADLRYRFANLAFEHYRGISRDQVRGRHLRDVLGDLVFERVRPQIEQALLQGKRVTFDAVTVFPRAGEREVHVEYLPHLLPTGAVGGIMSILTDVTDRNLAQRELARSEQRYRNFIQQSGEGIWRMELDEPVPTSASVERQIEFLYARGYLAECNDAMARMYGLSRADQLVGARLGDLMARGNPDSIAYLKAFIHSGYRLSDDECHEPDHVGQSGRCFVYNLIGHIENANLVRCWATQRDITDRKLAEEQRDALLASERAARAEAERAGRMKDEFLSMLSHELRTPLNAILGWAQLLRREDVSESDLAQGLESIERNSRAQAQIIEDLLDMSRIIAGKVRLDVGKIELSEVIDGAMDTVRHAARAKGVTIGKRLEGNDPLIVMGDENRLQQVVWNLLTNAIKFTPTGGRVDVGLRARPELGVAELTVTDTGIGIRAEFLPYVFERFRQADSSSTRLHGGLGLGLAIVRQMVEMHGGTVTADSAGEGQGATFRITLPLMPSPAPARGDGRVAPHVPATTGTLPPRTDESTRPRTQRALFGSSARHDPKRSLQGLQVLIVDDDPDALELFRRMLVEAHADVICCTTADDALKFIERAPPDILISDIGMPDHDGYWLLEQVRGRETRAASAPLSAIALTAFAGPQDRARALQAGFQAHIAKPVEPPDLIAAIARLAGRSVSSA